MILSKELPITNKKLKKMDVSFRITNINKENKTWKDGYSFEKEDDKIQIFHARLKDDDVNFKYHVQLKIVKSKERFFKKRVVFSNYKRAKEVFQKLLQLRNDYSAIYDFAIRLKES